MKAKQSAALLTFFSDGMLLKETVFLRPPPTLVTDGSYKNDGIIQVKLRFWTNVLTRDTIPVNIMKGGVYRVFKVLS